MNLKIKKIDKAQAVELLAAHVEKFVFGVFILGFVLFFIGALKQTPYPKRPDQLDTEAKRVSNKVDTSTFDPATDVPEVKELPKAQDVAAAAWNTSESWNRPISDSKKRRPEPKYLALQDLRVATGYGAIPIRVVVDDVAGAVPARGGLAVPPGAPPEGGGFEAAKRRGLGAQAPPPPGLPGGGGLGAIKPGGFRGLAGAANADGPAAAPAGSTLKGMQWAVVTGLVPYASQLKEYRSAFRDVRYANDQLDHPQYDSFDIERAEVLPDSADDVEMKWVAIDRKRAAEVQSTFAQLGTDPVDQVFEDPAICQPLPFINGKEHDKSVTHPKIPLGDQKLGAGAANVVAPRAPPGGLGGGGLGGGRLGGGGQGGFMGGGLRGGNMGARADGGLPGSSGPKIDYKLFRYFDYTVQPGKSYRYRVRLELANPNYNVPAQYLVNAQTRKGSTRAAAWSDPSPEVAVPRGFNMLAGAVKKASGLTEQKIEVLVRMWDQKEAVDASRLAELTRGQVANFAAEDTPIDGPSSKSIAFQTDTLVLDMTGGDSIPNVPRTKAPGQLLVLEPNGRLAVKSELTDIDTYDTAKRRLKELKDLLDAAKPDAEEAADDSSDRSRRRKPEPAASGGGGLGSLRNTAEAGGKAGRAPRP